MGVLGFAAQSVFGDRVPSAEERSLRRQARRLRRRARWAGRRRCGADTNSDTSSALLQKAVRTELTYQQCRQQRCLRLLAMYSAKGSHCGVSSSTRRVEACHLAILRLQQQLLAACQPEQRTWYPFLTPQAASGTVAAMPVSRARPFVGEGIVEDSPPPYSAVPWTPYLTAPYQPQAPDAAQPHPLYSPPLTRTSFAPVCSYRRCRSHCCEKCV